MIYITAGLFGMTVTCVVLILGHQYQSRILIKHRLSGSSGALSFPFDLVDEKSIANSTRNREISVDDASSSDKITKELFLAGFRYQRQIKFFSILRKFGFIFPPFLLLLYAFDGVITTQEIVNVGVIAFLLNFGLRFVIRIYKTRRQRRILRNLPQFLDLLSICVEAGLNFTAALERVIREVDPDEPLTKEFSLMYHEFLSGLSLSEACQRLARRCGVTDLSLLMNAMVQSDEMGASIGKTLKTQAAELRDKIRQRIRTRSLKIPVKILFPVAIIFISLLAMTLGPSLYRVTSSLEKAFANSQGGSAKWALSRTLPIK